ncbi:receptor expression-enhancing protein 1-like isoform X4 [Mya arenaria]|uniref:receptor expression-enhancing protein 1-like isoform X4 n=1 Tax=Mya arenaria TaxID=6604 RepID=UPI0022E1F396|nr:receptor expression-enhancing protein 1-like isoform X4 [Mya arenaria]
MVSAILSRVVILVFGTLYPAYASYKAVKTKNVKEYVKWMMYWIVFALFCAVETFADVFLSWIPFYYEIKIIFVFWLLSPVTKGASFIYRKFVHPQLNKREKEIDEAIAQARTKGYSTLVTLGSRGLTYATNVVVSTAIKGQSTLAEQIKKSYSTNDLRVRDTRRGPDVTDGMRYVDDSDEEFGLSRLEEVEHENSMAQEARQSDDDNIETFSEEIIYYQPRKSGYTQKEVMSDPYATLPRTRARNRPRLHQP